MLNTENLEFVCQTHFERKVRLTIFDQILNFYLSTHLKGIKNIQRHF